MPLGMLEGRALDRMSGLARRVGSRGGAVFERNAISVVLSLPPAPGAWLSVLSRSAPHVGPAVNQLISLWSVLVHAQLARGPPVVAWEKDPGLALARRRVGARKTLKTQRSVSDRILGS